MFLLHLVKTVESPAVESNAHIYLSTSRFRLHSVSVAGFQGKKKDDVKCCFAPLHLSHCDSNFDP